MKIRDNMTEVKPTHWALESGNLNLNTAVGAHLPLCLRVGVKHLLVAHTACGETVGSNAVLHEIIDYGLRTFFGRSAVVRVGVFLLFIYRTIGVTNDADFHGWVYGHELHEFFESRH